MRPETDRASAATGGSVAGEIVAAPILGERSHFQVTIAGPRRAGLRRRSPRRTAGMLGRAGMLIGRRRDGLMLSTAGAARQRDRILPLLRSISAVISALE